MIIQKFLIFIWIVVTLLGLSRKPLIADEPYISNINIAIPDLEINNAQISDMKINSTSDSFDWHNNQYQKNNTELTNFTSLHNKEKYLLTVTLISGASMVFGAGILYILPEKFTNWDKKEIKNVFSNWQDNVKNGPVIDKDDWFLNYVTHPYWGAVYYIQARNAGYGYFGSFIYSATLSTFFWEYGIEAFAEPPSIQDLIITPVAGAFLGELFYILSNKLKENIEPDSKKNYIIYPALLIMDPMFLLIEKTPLHNYVVDSNNGYNPVIPQKGSLKILIKFKLKSS